MGGMHVWDPWLLALVERGDDTLRIPVVSGPDRVHVLVAVGPGKHSSVMPGFGLTRAMTRTFDEASTSRSRHE